MARSPLHERNVRKLFKTGGTTYALTIPIEHIRQLKWQENQKLVVKTDEKNGRLVIEDWSE